MVIKDPTLLNSGNMLEDNDKIMVINLNWNIGSKGKILV